MVTACNLGCPVALARPQTRQKPLAPQPRIASLRPIRPPVNDGLQALLLYLINHHLVDWQDFHNTCAIIAERSGLARAAIPMLSLSLFGYRVSSALASSRSFSACLRASPNSCALRASRGGRLGPRRVRPSSSLALSSRVLSAGRSRLRDSLFLLRSCQARSAQSLLFVHQCVPVQIRYRLRPFNLSFSGSVSFFRFQCFLKLVQLFFFVFKQFLGLRRSHGL